MISTKKIFVHFTWIFNSNHVFEFGIGTGRG